MLFNHVHVFAASLVLVVPYLEECDCELDIEDLVPQEEGGEGGDDEGDYCEPEEEESSDCRSCLRSTCCPGYDECADNRTCSCVVGCMDTPGVDVAACARERCDVNDVALALAPMTRWCAIDESCVGPRYCEAPDEKPLPQFR